MRIQECLIGRGFQGFVTRWLMLRLVEPSANLTATATAAIGAVIVVDPLPVNFMELVHSCHYYLPFKLN